MYDELPVPAFLTGSCTVSNPQSEIRIPQSPLRWHTHLNGLVTPIHEISGLFGLAQLMIFFSSPL